jgi:hypothetical protein
MYVLIKRGKSVVWFKKEGDKLYTTGGGYHYYEPKTEEILETNNQARYFDQLDWTKTTLLRPDSEYGWLDRDGKFYGCLYMHHSLVAELILHKRMWELEDAGWARVMGKQTPVSMYKNRLSADQRNWLSLNGYEYFDDEINSRCLIDDTIMDK